MLLTVLVNSSPIEINRNWASNIVGGLQIRVLNISTDLSVLSRLRIGGIIQEINGL